MLLTFIKPYFTMKYMKAQYLKYTNNKHKNNSGIIMIDNNNDNSDNEVMNKRLMKGKSMSTACLQRNQQ